MQNPLLQTIEALAKEKGIEAETIITAIEDAVLTASRKYYKSNENLKTRFNPDTGQVDLFAIRHIVEEVADPATEISLTEARGLYGEEAEVDMEIEFPKRTDVLGRRRYGNTGRVGVRDSQGRRGRHEKGPEHERVPMHPACHVFFSRNR